MMRNFVVVGWHRQRKFAAMAEEAATAVGGDADVNTAAKVTDIAMAYLQDEVTFQMFSVIAQN